MMIKPSREQFLAYERVRQSGVTNMWNIPLVCKLAGEGLTEDEVFYIFKYYHELWEEYME